MRQEDEVKRLKLDLLRQKLETIYAKHGAALEAIAFCELAAEVTKAEIATIERSLGAVPTLVRPSAIDDLDKIEEGK